MTQAIAGDVERSASNAMHNTYLDMIDHMRRDHLWLYAMIDHHRKVSAEWAITRASTK